MMMLQQAARRVAGVLGHDSAWVRGARPLYERALAFLSERGIPWTINGAPFRISPLHRHRMASVYDREVARYLSEHVRPGDVCFDVGANVGVYALQFARWTGASGKVVAFEPNPVSADVLARHIRMNALGPVVEIIQAAVADRPGVSTLHMADADGMSRLGAPNPEIAASTRPTEVPVTTIDQVCRERALSPRWLLVDVEGFEFAVLSGGRQTFQRLGTRLNTVVEMHPDAWAVAGWSRAEAERLLRELSLAITPLSGQQDPLGEYGHVLLRRAGALVG